MFRLYLSKQITRFVMFLFITCTCLLTSSVFAQLAIDSHIARNIVGPDGNTLVTAYVSIDALSYDGSGGGVVYLDGTFYVHNYDQKSGINYSGELRLEIFDMEGNAYLPHVEAEVYGSLKKNDEDANWWDVYHDISESTNLHLDCLFPTPGAEPITIDEQYEMSANIALRVHGAAHRNETWAIPYSSTFEHKPETDVEQLVGIGPTMDSETFSDDCIVNGDNNRAEWESLLYTDGPYDVVYWYVKEPGDTSYYGTNVETDWGDGAARRATMTHPFPDDVDNPNTPGNEDAVWYDIGALVYRSDNNIDWYTYKVWVVDEGK